MGNLGKFKRKIKNNNADVIILDEKARTILMRLSINYAHLLQDKEYIKALFMLNWAIKNKDPLAVEAIDIMNQTMAQALNIGYKSFPIETRLTFFLENLHYVEQFFSLPSTTEDLLDTDSEEYKTIEKVLSDENESLLYEYILKGHKLNKLK